MSTPTGTLAAAIAAKDADAAASAYEAMRGTRLDVRPLAAFADLMARTRKNQLAWEAFEAGRTAHGLPKLLQAGLNLNALLYACCREASMLDKAMEVWGLMGESGSSIDIEPAEKLLLANLAKAK